MIDFIQEVFQPINFPFTVALIAVMIYWCMAFVGVVGMDLFDLDFGAGVDADSFSIGGLVKAAANFMYLGEVPLALVGSFMVLFMWITTVSGNHYFNPEFGLWLSVMMFLPNMILSLLATKILLFPIAKLFSERERSPVRQELFGKIGMVTSSEVTPEFGIMEIQQDGPPLVLNIRTRSGVRLIQGTAVVIIGYNPQNDTFLVELSK